MIDSKLRKSVYLVGVLIVADARATEQLPSVGELPNTASLFTSNAIIPTNRVALRNNSKSDLRFYSNLGGTWNRYKLSSGGEALVPAERLVVSIPTNRNAKDPEASVAPAINVEEIGKSTGSFTIIGPHFVRELTGGDRWELCWSQSQRRWVVQTITEDLCWLP